jgi:ribosomal protein L13E
MVRLGLGEWGQRGLSVRQARRLAGEVKRRVCAGENIEALRRELKKRRAVDTSRTRPR